MIIISDRIVPIKPCEIEKRQRFIKEAFLGYLRNTVKSQII